MDRLIDCCQVDVYFVHKWQQRLERTHLRSSLQQANQLSRMHVDI